MTDIRDDISEVLRRKASELPPHREVPSPLAGRVRRRIAINAFGGALVVVVLAGGTVAGLRAIGPGAGSVVIPGGSETTTPPGVASCASTGLRATASIQGAAGSREGSIDLTNTSGERCTLEGTPTITLLDENLRPITSGVRFDQVQSNWQVQGSPEPTGWPVVTLRPGDAASIRVAWGNWCPDGRSLPTWSLEVPGSGAVEVKVSGDLGPPPCNGVGQPTSIEVGPFEPSESTPQQGP